MTDLEMQQMARNVRAIKNQTLYPALAGTGLLAIVLLPVLGLAAIGVIAYVMQAVVHAFTW